MIAFSNILNHYSQEQEMKKNVHHDYSGHISDTIFAITSTGLFVQWSSTQVNVNSLSGSQTITEFVA